MKFSIVFIFILLLLASCRKEIANYDKLTAAERAALARRYSAKCTSDSAVEIKNFKRDSNSVFSSSNFSRNKSFKHEYKDGSTIMYTIDLQVWKQTSSEIYFVWTETGESEVSKFLRITKAENETMIDNLLSDLCSQKYKGSINNSVNLTYEYERQVAAKRIVYTDSVASRYDHPAGFANFTVKRSKKTIEEDVNDVNKSYTSTLVAGTLNDLSSSNPSAIAVEYCYFDLVDNSYQFVKSTTERERGFRITCTNSLPAGWNLNL